MKFLPATLSLLTVLAVGCSKEHSSHRNGSSIAESGDARPSEKVGLTMTQDGASLTDPDNGVDSAKAILFCDGFDDHTPGNAPVSFHHNDDKLKVYDHPTHCKLKLLEFTYANTTFDPKPGHGFTTYLPGDTATFTNGTIDLTITVISQFPSPLNGDATVEYRFAAISKETKGIENLNILVTENELLISGKPSPQYHVDHAKIVALTPYTLGVAFDVSCRMTLTDSSDFAHAKCVTEAMKGLKAALAVNTGEAVTQQTLGALITPAATVDHLPGFAFVPPGGGMPKGGFQFTVPFATLGFTGLADLNTKSIELVLGHDAASSFFYAIAAKARQGGCTNPAAVNFNTLATTDDGSCKVPPACANRATWDPNAPLDSDCDGVPDSLDHCPNTPVGQTVDAHGCSTQQLADDDGDGIPNYLDVCPNTPHGQAVDANGCSAHDLADDDGDGVPNFRDLCPGTPPGVHVDATGCPAIDFLSFLHNDDNTHPASLGLCSGNIANPGIGMNGCTLADAIAGQPVNDLVGTLGGTMSVSPTGDATYSISLEFPPGTMNVQPALSLSYNSAAARGFAGFGFDLGGISQIRRCANNMNRNGRDTSVIGMAMTKLCLDGQYLVAVSGAYGADGTIYKTERDSFTTVTSHGSNNGFPASFTAVSKTGSTIEYGTGTGSVLIGDLSAPAVWAASKMLDRRGNYMTYDYSTNAAEGLQLLTHIAYTGNDTAGLQPYYDVNLIYQDANEAIPTFGSRFRQTTVSLLNRITVTSRASNAEVKRYQLTYDSADQGVTRLASVRECRGPSASQCLHPTTFAYSFSDATHFVPTTALKESDLGGVKLASNKSQHQSFIDMRGDGVVDYIWIPDGSNDIYVATGSRSGSPVQVTFTNPHVAFAKSSLSGSSAPTSLMGLNSDSGSQESFTDINGDGLPDRVFVQTDGNGGTAVFVMLNDGNGNLGAPQNWLSQGSGPALKSRDNQHWQFADVNGDGRKDLIWVPDGSDDLYVAINNGNGFNAPTRWLTGVKAWSTGGASEEFIDTDGDGRADFVWIPDGDTVLHAGISNGSSFSNNTISFSVDARAEDGGTVQYIDVNGDGVVDRVWFPKGLASPAVYVALGNNAGGFNDATLWLANFALDSGNAFDNTKSLSNFSDLNHDGMADLVFLPKDSTNLYGFYSTGTSFHAAGGTVDYGQPGNPVTPPAEFGSGMSVDADGDGLSDVIFFSSDKTTITVATRTHNLNRLTAVTDGHGRQTRVGYVFPTDSSITRAPTSAFPLVSTLPQGPIVGSLSFTETDGSFVTKTYSYYGLEIHQQGLGALGFAQVNELVSADSILTTTNYSQDYVHFTTGQPTLIQKAAMVNGSPVVISNMVRTFQLQTYDAGTPASRVFSTVAVATTRDYDFNPANNAVVRTEKVTTTYGTDDLGNIDTLVRAVTDSFGTTTRTTSNTYHPIGFTQCGCTDAVDTMTETTVTAEGLTFTQQVQFPEYTNSGEIAKEVRLSGDVQTTREYVYDSFGNRTKTTISGPNFATRTESATYSADGRFTASSTDAIGHTSTMGYDADTGLITFQQDASGVKALTSYDLYGNIQAKINPDGTTTHFRQAFCSSVTICRSGESFVITIDKTGGESNASFYDSFARLVRATKSTLGGKVIEEVTTFAKGRMATHSAPYLQGDTPIMTVVTYDQIGRVIETTSPLANGERDTMTREYDGFTVKETNGVGQVKTSVYDAMGQLRKVIDNAGTVITNTFGYTGLMSETVTPSGTTTYTYDDAHRRTSITDPSFGTRTYTVNAIGDVVQVKDAKGIATCFAYDKLGRLVKRIDAYTGSAPLDDCAGDDGAPDTDTTRLSTWTYDDDGQTSIGHLTAVSSKDVQKAYHFDSLSRLAQVDTKIKSERFSYAVSYDVYGRPQHVNYPAGFSAYNFYDDHGNLSEVRDASNKALWHANATDAFEHVADFTLGNGIRTHRGYEQVRGLLTDVTYTGGATSLPFNQHYKYDEIGNLTERSWDTPAAAAVEHFHYDDMNRLVEADYADGRDPQRVSYDSMGNITFKTGVGVYQYGDSCASVHASQNAVTKITGEKAATYCYDANGHLASGGGITVDYTAFEKPEQIQKGFDIVTFLYDASRRMVQRIDQGNSDRMTFYVDGMYEKVYEAGTYYHRYYVGTEVIVVRGADGIAKPNYLHHDHLGSIIAVTDQQGEISAYLNYDAFGKRMQYSWTTEATDIVTQEGFTSHEMLDDFELIHMGGRVYDPTLGRVLSPDPSLQDPTNTQNYNRYTYVLNNPLNAVDPSGFNIFDDIGNALGGAVSGAGNFFSSVGSGISGAWSATSSWFVGAANTVAGATVSAFNSVASWTTGAYNTVSAFASSAASTVWGGLRTFGIAAYNNTLGSSTFMYWFDISMSVLEIGTGIALCVASGGWACAAAAIMIIHGIDTIQATVRHDPHTLVVEGLEKAGVPEPAAELTYAGIDLVAGVAAPEIAARDIAAAAEGAGDGVKATRAVEAGIAASEGEKSVSTLGKAKQLLAARKAWRAAAQATLDGGNMGEKALSIVMFCSEYKYTMTALKTLIGHGTQIYSYVLAPSYRIAASHPEATQAAIGAGLLFTPYGITESIGGAVLVTDFVR